ncbi:hypothetical protein [Cupriavidus taiwanensis]|nr:hypothetical protein [Cupriavidus taiwanensis]
MELSELTLESFNRYCVPGPDLKLPARDVLGVKTGAKYDPAEFVSVRKFRFGTAGFTQHTRGGHHFVFLGSQADKLDLRLKTNCWVDSVRCNYPVVIPRATTRRATHGSSFDLALADRMLTVALRERPNEPHLHALFLDDRDKDKAAAFLSRRGVSYERVHPELFPKLALSNAAQCYQWIMRLDDIRPLRERALAFSQKLLVLPRKDAKTARTRKIVSLENELDVVMAHMAIVEAIRVDDAYTLLAIAIIFGYLTLDPNKRLAPMEMLSLIQEADHGY